MTESELVLKLIKAKGLSQSDLGRACDVTPTTIGRWIKGLVLPAGDKKRTNDDQWSELASALRALGIDPTQVRPLPLAGSKEVRPDLTLLVDKLTTEKANEKLWSRERLLALDALLEAVDAHNFLRAIIADRLQILP